MLIRASAFCNPDQSQGWARDDSDSAVGGNDELHGRVRSAGIAGLPRAVVGGGPYRGMRDCNSGVHGRK